jgi:hypothetical protein
MIRWCNRLEQLIYDLEDMDNRARLDAARNQRPYLAWTKHLDVRGTCKQLKAILFRAQRDAPFCRCPRHDSDPACPVCEGNGWITASQVTAQHDSEPK